VIHPTARARQRVHYADALRALAIFAILVHHVSQTTRMSWPWRFGTLEAIGVWSVDCFFVLSGFLLGAPYLRAIRDGAALPSTALFLRRRFFRIYPLYAVAVIFSLATSVESFTIERVEAYLATHLTLTHGFVVSQAVDVNGPLWTMAIDAQFYVALPLVAGALWLVLHRRPRAARIAGTAAALAAAVAVSFVWRLVLFAHHPVAFGAFAWQVVNARNIIGTGGSFALGTAVAFALERPGARRRATAIVAVLAGVGALLVLVDALPATNTTPWVQASYDLLGAASGALLLYGFLAGAAPSFDAVVASPFVEASAALAYAVYLFHTPVMLRMRPIVAPVAVALGPPRSTFLFLAVVLGVTLPIAIAGHRWVERPFLSIRDRNREAAAVTAP